MKKYIFLILLVFYLNSFGFTDEWVSNSGQNFSLLNSTALTMKKESIIDLAGYLSNWKNAFMLISINNQGDILCEIVIEPDNFNIIQSTEFVSWLYNWFIINIENENQLYSFMKIGFNVNLCYKFPRGTINFYASLRNSGYVKIYENVDIKAGSYSAETTDWRFSPFYNVLSNNWNAGYLYRYVIGDFISIRDLPVPPGLDDSAYKEFESLWIHLQNKEYFEVEKIAKKYKITCNMTDSMGKSILYYYILQQADRKTIESLIGNANPILSNSILESITNSKNFIIYDILKEIDETYTQEILDYAINKRDINLFDYISNIENNRILFLCSYMNNYKEINDFKILLSENIDLLFATMPISKNELSPFSYAVFFGDLFVLDCILDLNLPINIIPKDSKVFNKTYNNLIFEPNILNNMFQIVKGKVLIINNRKLEIPVESEKKIISYLNKKLDQIQFDIIYKLGYELYGRSFFSLLPYVDNYPQEIFISSFFENINIEFDSASSGNPILRDVDFPINITDKTGCSLLMLAIQKKDDKFSNYLIGKGIDLTILDSNGNSALDYAVNSNNEAIKKKIDKKLKKLIIN